MNKYYPYILYLAIALLVVVLAANDFGPMTSLQRSVDDMLCNATAEESIRPNVVLVDIDAASLDKYGPWPWDHDLVADLTAAVASGEPKSILVDIDLYEDSEQETSGHTTVLAEQLTWIKQAVLPYDIAEASYRTSKTRNHDYLFKNSLAVDNPVGEMDEHSSLLVRKVFLPADRLLTNKPLLGFDYVRPDQDRELRHHAPIMNFEGYYYPSSSLLAAATYYGVSPARIKVIEGKEIQLGSAHTIPINEDGTMFVRFSKGVPFAKYSAAQVLSDDFSRETLKNKAVVIGQLRGEDSEAFSTPVQADMPEMLVKANVIENIVNDSHLTVRDDLARLTLFLILALGALGAFLLPRVVLMYRMIVLGAALFLIANAEYLLFSHYGMIVPSIYVAMELLLFMIASPMLDSDFLTGDAAETSKTKAWAKKTKLDTNETDEQVPVRELKTDTTSLEDVETTALEPSVSSSASSGDIDHQTISLDDSPQETVANEMPSDELEDSFDYEEEELDDSGLTDSDAALLENDKKESTPGRSLSDSGSFGRDSSGIPIGQSDVKQMGRYQIQGILGKGAMGSVYRGVDPAINRPVALKTIRLDFVNDPEELAELKERLHREAQAAGKLGHPNIVTIYDVGSEGSLQYIAMEYLEGRTLEDMIKKKTRFNYRIIAQIITQICSALEYAHERGIVHRDVKPANIMVLDDYRVKVMDFGIARIDSNSMTKTGIAMGTPNYISPEQLKGKEIDRRADIFSLGVMMYEMLLGKRPFKGENLTSLMYAILNTEPEKPSSVRPQVPLLFDHIIGRALAKDPSERYQKASDVTADLQDFVESFSRS